MLEREGFPIGAKSSIIALPTGEYSAKDLFRGLIDADGSLCITSDGFPMISYTTSSDEMATQYINFLKTITGKRKEVNRNKRDGIYNICLYREDAQKLTSFLYEGNCLALPRKMAKSKKLIAWKRPFGMIMKVYAPWTKTQDEFILGHPLAVSMKELGRSEKSIRTRIWRINKKLSRTIV